MVLSRNEIRSRAIAFSRDWSSAKSESADRQTFWNEFFEVFGRKRRQVASFEEPVKKLSGDWGFIDLFWPGTLLVEHKSAGQDLSKAHAQGMAYIRGLIDSGRENEVPRYLIVSDFARIALHDLEPEQDPDLPLLKRLPPSIEFTLADFPKVIHAFGFIAGYRTYRVKEEDPANIEATELLAKLHDVLEDGGYPKADIDRFLVRILFCLFAEDTDIFPPDAFQGFLKNHTTEDGANLGPELERLFSVLDTPEDKRQKNLPEDLADLPYVNGRLFHEHLAFADFNSDMRNQLLICTAFKWSRISPAIFGSLFQGIMEKRERRQIGAHYTSERDILKVIRSLFLDDLQAEFEKIHKSKAHGREARLEEFQKKLASLRLLDPACGCGNFLILAYRELRDLEIKVLMELHPGGQQVMTLEDVNRLSKVDVDQLYGIEILDWPSRIAEVAVWLMDHLMNQKLSTAFGQLYQRFPLLKSATIVTSNAIPLDWKTILPPTDNVLILGNPPFVGKHLMNADQAADMELVCGNVEGGGVLDYVTAWYFKAAEYIRGTKIRCAFVSTNSITQGEQAGPLWNFLFQRYGLKIHFGHRTFSWISEARGKAHVHVVIIGFGLFDWPDKRLYDYAVDSDHPLISNVVNISPYLVQGPDLALLSRSTPISDVPECQYGNKPTDGGHLIIEEEDRKEFLAKNPEARKYIRPLLCAEEYLHGIPRWCLWLVNAAPQDIRNSPGIKQRVEAVRDFRLASKKEPTRRKAAESTLFAEIRQPTKEFIVIPQHTGETRLYIPFGYFSPRYILHNSCTALPNATPYHFGVLSSVMHMAWMKQVCGRLESRYRYSNSLVYNNYPWPEEATDTQKVKVEQCAQAVLDARQPFLDAGQTLADLYDPLTMPGVLLKAHQALDRAVDRCYRKEVFENDRQRVEFLFALYQKLTAPLVAAMAPKRTRRSKA